MAAVRSRKIIPRNTVMPLEWITILSKSVKEMEISGIRYEVKEWQKNDFKSDFTVYHRWTEGDFQN